MHLEWQNSQHHHSNNNNRAITMGGSAAQEGKALLNRSAVLFGGFVSLVCKETHFISVWDVLFSADRFIGGP